MSGIWDLVISMAHGHHSANEIMEELDRTFGPKAMSKPAIYKILEMVKAGKVARNYRGCKGLY